MPTRSPELNQVHRHVLSLARDERVRFVLSMTAEQLLLLIRNWPQEDSEVLLDSLVAISGPLLTIEALAAKHVELEAPAGAIEFGDLGSVLAEVLDNNNALTPRRILNAVRQSFLRTQHFYEFPSRGSQRKVQYITVELAKKLLEAQELNDLKNIEGYQPKNLGPKSLIALQQALTIIQERLTNEQPSQ